MYDTEVLYWNFERTDALLTGMSPWVKQLLAIGNQRSEAGGIATLLRRDPL